MTPELVIRRAGNGERATQLNRPVRCLVRMARWARRRSAFHAGDGVRRTTDAAAYSTWRAAALHGQLESHFSPAVLAGKDVVDFGCGGGELSCALIRDWGCHSVTGIDRSESAVHAATNARGRLPDDRRQALRFIRSASEGPIDLADESIDVVCCFDAVEHIADIAAAAVEWRRMLRPGGQVWIWWSPWR
ncbi:MAG: class I SAM-dependent methyltransferase, partial [Phycisphaerales bacterium]|nr:class I SAM-dependent methyltransferase [Phycisphaerales bacterium]